MATRKFLLKLKTGLFVLAISEKESRYFVGSVVYYFKSGIWSEGTLKTQWHIKHFLENSHEDVYAAALKWVAESLGEPLSIEEIPVVCE
jgi:hypothetical protein